MTEDRHDSELDARLALDELCLWVSALAEDAENANDIANLQNAYSAELERYLASGDGPVPRFARQALDTLEQRARELGVV